MQRFPPDRFLVLKETHVDQECLLYSQNTKKKRLFSFFQAVPGYPLHELKVRYTSPFPFRAQVTVPGSSWYQGINPSVFGLRQEQ